MKPSVTQQSSKMEVNGSAKDGVKRGRPPGSGKKAATDFFVDEKQQHMDEIQNDIQHGVAHVAHPTSGLTELEERVNDLGDSWESDSLFADALLTENKFVDGK